MTDTIGRPLEVGQRVRQVGYWHGGRKRDVSRVGTVESFTRYGRAVVRLAATDMHREEVRRLGVAILRRTDI